MKRAIIFFGFIFIALQGTAYGYIDPGSGGYLITTILAMIGGFFAFASAFVIHIYRRTVGKVIGFLWRKHRILFILGILAASAGIGMWIYKLTYEPPVPKFDPALTGVRIPEVSQIQQVVKVPQVSQIEKAVPIAQVPGAPQVPVASTPEPKPEISQAGPSPGYSLFEGRLIDLKGNVVKKWSSISLGTIDTNGDYYGQKYFEAPTWGRYTWDDKVIWEKNFPIHHEILLTPKDTLITFTKEVHEYMGRKVEFDIIVEFDKNGNELQRFSFWENLKEFQQYHRKLELDMPPTFLIPEDHRKDKSIWGGNYDYYHLNSLSLIPNNQKKDMHPAFRPGNWLISFRHGSMVFILDQDTKKVLWRAIYDQVKDRLEGPHAPLMLPSGNILLFDNGRYRKWSRLIELNPVDMSIVWEYRNKDFYTLSQGYVQKLPNGNMLVTEAEEGYVFEVTHDKKIVWEFYHPDVQNETNSTDKEKWGRRQEIYRMVRYSPEQIEPFLKASDKDVILRAKPEESTTADPSRSLPSSLADPSLRSG